MKLWIDDIRRPPDDSWTWVRTIALAKEVLEWNRPTVISFDHDMGLHMENPDAENAHLRMGPDQSPDKCCCVVARFVCEEDAIPKEILIHTMNPQGARDLVSIFTTYWKAVREGGIVGPVDHHRWSLEGLNGTEHTISIQPYRKSDA